MIRKAFKNDIDSINCLGENLFPNFHKSYNLLYYISNDNYIVLVDEEKEIKAFLIVLKNIDCYEIESIVVKPECQNRGIATSLLNYFINHFCGKNDEIFLEVSSINGNAIKLYRKFKFKIINKRKNYYDNADALIMKLVIE